MALWLTAHNHNAARAEAPEHIFCDKQHPRTTTERRRPSNPCAWIPRYSLLGSRLVALNENVTLFETLFGCKNGGTNKNFECLLFELKHFFIVICWRCCYTTISKAWRRSVFAASDGRCTFWILDCCSISSSAKRSAITVELNFYPGLLGGGTHNGFVWEHNLFWWMLQSGEHFSAVALSCVKRYFERMLRHFWVCNYNYASCFDHCRHFLN